MIHFINYADKCFKRKQKINAFSARLFGNVDVVKSYNSNDICTEFYNKNSTILDSKKGGGYWLWKPYIILRHLENIKYGEYLFYCDSGSVIIRSLEHAKNVMEKDNTDIMLYDIPLLEFQWTKKGLFEHMNCNELEYKYTNQIQGGYIFIRKSEFSLFIFREYLKLCECIDNLNDSNNIGIDNNFIAHRHDQSILSLLAKKNGIKPYRDPSDYGEFPARYMAPGRFLFTQAKKNDFKTFILATRKENTLIYVLKYMFRKIINLFIKS